MQECFAVIETLIIPIDIFEPIHNMKAHLKYNVWTSSYWNEGWISIFTHTNHLFHNGFKLESELESIHSLLKEPRYVLCLTEVKEWSRNGQIQLYQTEKNYSTAKEALNRINTYKTAENISKYLHGELLHIDYILNFKISIAK